MWFAADLPNSCIFGSGHLGFKVSGKNTLLARLRWDIAIIREFHVTDHIADPPQP